MLRSGQPLRALVRTITANACSVRLVSTGRRPASDQAPILQGVTKTEAKKPPAAKPRPKPVIPQWKAPPAVLPALARLTAAADKTDSGEFVTELKALAKHRSPQLVDSLGYLISRMYASITTAEHTASCLWSMGKLGFKGTLLIQQALLAKYLQKLCYAKDLTSRDLSMGLDGLSKTGMLMTHLLPNQRDAIMRALEQTAPDSARSLATILLALGKLDAQWGLFPQSTQDVLWKGLAAVAKDLNALDAAMITHSFGQLALDDANDITDAQHDLILEIALRGMNKKAAEHNVQDVCQQNAMTVLGLGKMSVEYDSLPEIFSAHMNACILHRLPVMDEQGVSNVIHAYGLLGCPWTAIPSLQTAMQQAAMNKMHVMSSQHIFMTLHGMAMMETPWHDLLPELQQKIENAVTSMTNYNKTADAFASHRLAVSIYSLGVIGAGWSSFGKEFQRAVLDAGGLQGNSSSWLHKNTTISKNTSDYIFGLGLMAAPFAALPAVSLKAVEKTMLDASCAPQSLSNLLLGMAKMDSKWSDLPVSTLGAILTAFERLVSGMDIEEVADCMHAFTLLCFDFTDDDQERAELMWEMLTALVKEFDEVEFAECSPEGSKQCAMFFGWLTALPGGKEIYMEELGIRPQFPGAAAHEVSEPPKRVDCLVQYLSQQE